MTTHLDVSPWAGDPTLNQTEIDWAADMVSRLRTANKQVAKQIWRDMTPNEQTTILEFCFKQAKKLS